MKYFKVYLMAMGCVLLVGANLNAQNTRQRDRLAQQKAEALIEASKGWDLEDVFDLINAGADVNTSTRRGDTPLMFAAENGQLEIVLALLRGGADTEAQNVLGWTALMFAAREGHLPVVSLLIRNGADVNHYQENRLSRFWQARDRLSVLMVAAKEGHFDVVQALLMAGADVHHQARYEYTSLMAAAQNGHPEIAQV